ncbi:hypothetical protein AOQ73_18260 [Bradyrhizobium pachyrhizi]|uniref:very short patch repair endonuclease n=1 Tax=Bradyrhizobium pachyrhizi TaxID=280333 RepID=UPI0007054BF1|nr:very short patch repair endonuclease [Bradyrhizobium pachyrhizi]KRQ01297.1 hypothetical protein AOQ73_18260 [Bradyrhizobium pachyrhizi]
MARRITASQRSRMMASVGKANTRPELAVRRFLHRQGFRYTLHQQLPGTPDIVFPKYKTVLFVHGCFWHQCPHCGMGARQIARNRDYWLPKFNRNRSRDERVQKQLIDQGWRVLVVWECQISDTRVLNSVARKLRRG